VQCKKREMARTERFWAFVSELVSDLKSSRRFQVATIIWMPLLVTLGVLLTRFGLHHTLEATIHEWKTTYVPESTINFPDLQMYFASPQAPAFNCQQRGVGATIVPVTCAASWLSSKTCYTFKFSAFQSVGLDSHGYTIVCNFTFAPNPYTQNNAFYMWLPGGFATLTGGWGQDSRPIRPNWRIGVNLEPVH